MATMRFTVEVELDNSRLQDLNMDAEEVWRVSYADIDNDAQPYISLGADFLATNATIVEKEIL